MCHLLILLIAIFIVFDVWQPPPPGYAPNAAQAMAAQGQPVNVQQRQAGWFSGGSDGGYTIW